jgi:hypothetical protein
VSTCGICGKSKNSAKSITVYTARTLGQRREKTAYRNVTVTTSYGEFEAHRYDVCKSCNTARSVIIPLTVYLIAAALVYVAIRMNALRATFWGEVGFVGGALFLAVLPSAIVAGFLVPETVLKKKAVAERTRAQPSETFKGYLAHEYEKLDT